MDSKSFQKKQARWIGHPAEKTSGGRHDETRRPTTINVVQYNESEFNERETTTHDQLQTLACEQFMTWVDVEGLSDVDSVSQVATQFGLHSLIIEDLLSQHQYPKVEQYGDALFIVVRMASLSGTFTTEQLGIVLRPNIVVTFHDRPDGLDHVRSRVRKQHLQLQGTGYDRLVYCILDAVIDGYFPALERINERLAKVDDQLAAAPSVDAITRLQRLRSLLFMIRRSLEPHREVISHLTRDKQFTEETAFYMRDCMDHLTQLIHVTETSHELAADLRDYCFAEMSFTQGQTGTLLTIVATIFIPLGFVVGLYGMNFDPEISAFNMPETKWQYGYPFALGLMASITAISGWGLWFLHRRQVEKRCQRYRSTQNILADDD